MKQIMLVVEEDRDIRSELAEIFQDNYRVALTSGGKEGIIKLSEVKRQIGMVILDLDLEDFPGLQLLKLLFSKRITEDIPIVVLSSAVGDEPQKELYAMGAVAVIQKPINRQDIHYRVLEARLTFNNRKSLQDQINKTQLDYVNLRKQMREFNEGVLDALSNIVELRNLESGNHVNRVKGMTAILGSYYRQKYPDELSEELLNMTIDASAIHDIGKICVPEHILSKPGKLTKEERVVMMSHTTKGGDVLRNLCKIQTAECFKVTYDVVRYHHERDDGEGYPNKLKGEEIPLSARLVSICDVYDALVSERIYKKAYSNTEAYNMIMNGDCGKFHPHLIDAFTAARADLERFSDANIG